MKTKISKVLRSNSWKDVLNVARVTVGKGVVNNEPSELWKKKVLRSEHSPIRELRYKWVFTDLPYWVSVHFTRHHVGIDHYVKTSRTDKTGVDRTKLPQDNPVNHSCDANLQAILNISKERLCNKASFETKKAWVMVQEEIKKLDPMVAYMMVPKCVYRGGKCPEFDSCGWIDTEEGQRRLKWYWSDGI